MRTIALLASCASGAVSVPVRCREGAGETQGSFKQEVLALVRFKRSKSRTDEDVVTCVTTETARRSLVLSVGWWGARGSHTSILLSLLPNSGAVCAIERCSPSRWGKGGARGGGARVFQIEAKHRFAGVICLFRDVFHEILEERVLSGACLAGGHLLEPSSGQPLR